VNGWTIELAGVGGGIWLESDPGASGGLDDIWMIAVEPIPAADVSLLERDLVLRWGP
jgi:hypothetical protein